jgi:xanthine dehydrogenase accessory factor
VELIPPDYAFCSPVTEAAYQRVYTVSQLKDLLLERLGQGPAVLVQVVSIEGSVPRETGTWMAVFDAGVVGTIGGGHLEHQAMAAARAQLRGGPAVAESRFVLGPSLGQCCGGVMNLRFETVGPADVAALRQRLPENLRPLALFGGGHVGHALVQLLSRLPYALSWIDSRDGIFPPALPANVSGEHSDPVQGAVRGLAPQSRVLIMSFSHAEDLDIVAECLKRQRDKGDLPYIGLIGSRTKWATFRHRLQARGFSDEELAHVTSPIGLPGITGKEPEVIAVAVAAQLLLIDSGKR